MDFFDISVYGKDLILVTIFHRIIVMLCSKVKH